MHAGVFLPASAGITDSDAEKQVDERFSFGAAGRPDLRLVYWDRRAYVQILDVNACDVPGVPGVPTGSPMKTTSEKRKRKLEGPAEVNPGKKVSLF